MNISASRSRRAWLQLAGSTLILHTAAWPNADAAPLREHVAWKMGVIADLHHGLAPDALHRLDRFMQAVDQQQPDCLLQLGDFNFGVGATECMNMWRQFRGPKYHVLGNHDMDKATKEEMIATWEMPAAYYSFDHRGWHFVVLDRNHLRTDEGKFIDYGKANFYVDGRLQSFANEEQLEWLREDLQRSTLPTVVFAHQGLGMDEQIVTDSAAGTIESVLEAARIDGQAKVKACFCGHHHLDRYHRRSGIHYVWINSASYYWVGDEYGRMAPYTLPLYTFLTFHGDDSIAVQGMQSDWASPSPKERGYPNWNDLTPHIRERQLEC